MSNNCPKYNQLFNNWKEKISKIDELYQEFKTTGKQETREQIEELKKQVKQDKKKYQDFINEIVEFNNKEVKRIDADILKKIEELAGIIHFKVENGNISSLTVSNSSTEHKIINQALSFAKYFDSLQTLYCYDNPELESLPELPNSLQWLSCSNNPKLESLY